MSLTTRYRIRIQWADCDAARRVHYPNYFRLFDCSTHNLFEQAGLPLPVLLSDGTLHGLPIVDARARFRKSCVWGDWIEVESHVAEWGRTSMTLQHRIWRGDEMLVEGHEVRVWSVPDPEDPEKGCTSPIPDAIRDRFAGAAA